MNKIRIGTRGSELALKQAAMVQAALEQTDAGIEAEIVVIHTRGDKVIDKPLAEIGDKGVFVSEFEQALLAGDIDLAVHSAKDLPMILAKGLIIAAVLPRGDVRDVLVIPKGGRMPQPVRESEQAFRIGSGSRRRQQQAVRLWENVVCADIRGNVDTRLRRLQEGGCAERKYDGIILAKAGLDRLEIMSRYEEEFTFSMLDPEQFLPAACQGIIAVETVQGSDAFKLCRKITDGDTEFCFQVEREALRQLSADCNEAAAAWCRWEAGELVLDVMYAERRQRLVYKADASARLCKGLQMAREAARSVKGQECI